MGSSLCKVPRAPKRISDPPTEITFAAANGACDDGGFGQPFEDPRARDDNVTFPLDNIDLSSMSDEALAKLISIAPKLHDYGGVRVVRLSKTLACKGGDGVLPGESKNMELAAESLHLPVPKVHRTFTTDFEGVFGQIEKAHFIIMDYMPGQTVDQCWDALKENQRQSVTDQVVAMIDKMQSTTLDLPPGPVGWIADQKFVGPWFTEYGAGPFATLQELEKWCNHKIDVSVRYEQLEHRPSNFKFDRLVLTHQDIAPRNLVLDAQGKVWMIDWGLAGVYPPGFEQAVLQVGVSRNEEFTRMVLSKLSHRGDSMTQQYRSISYGLSLAARL